MENLPAIDATTPPPCRFILEYCDLNGRLLQQAKEPGFTIADWAPLAEMVAVDEFKRVGAFKEVMNWQEYTAFQTEFARTSRWEGTFRRINTAPGLVFLELEERVFTDDRLDAINSMSVFAFNPAGKICHLDVYLQGTL